MRREARNLTKKLNEKGIEYFFISDDLSLAHIHMNAEDFEYIIGYLINIFLQSMNLDYDYLQSKEFMECLHKMQPKI